MKKTIPFFKETARILSILVAAYLCLSNAYYHGINTGFEVGLDSHCYPTINGLCITHADPIVEIIAVNIYANILLLLYIFGSVLKRSFFSQGISVLSSLLLAATFIYTYWLKSGYPIHDDAHSNLIRETLSEDFIRSILALILVCYQVFATIGLIKQSIKNGADNI